MVYPQETEEASTTVSPGQVFYPTFWLLVARLVMQHSP